MPLILTGKKYFGFKGVLSLLKSAGFPSFEAYTLKMEKSPV